MFALLSANLILCASMFRVSAIVRASCVRAYPTAVIVARCDNTHLCKASFPLRFDSDLGFHCKAVVAVEMFPEWSDVIPISSWSKV